MIHDRTAYPANVSAINYPSEIEKMPLHFAQLLPTSWGAKSNGLQFVVAEEQRRGGRVVYTATWARVGGEAIDVVHIGHEWDDRTAAEAACEDCLKSLDYPDNIRKPEQIAADIQVVLALWKATPIGIPNEKPLSDAMGAMIKRWQGKQ
jgi:hypothetical protein